MDSRRVTLVAGGFLGLHVLLTYWRPFPFWGADHLAYYHALPRAIFLVASAILLFHQSRTFLINWLGGIWDRLVAMRYGPTLAYLCLVVFGTGMFFYFKVSTPFLGDGQLYLTELGSLAGWDRVDNAPLSFWLVRCIHSLGAPVKTTYQIYSSASGAIFLLLSVPAARIMGEDRRSRFVFLGFLLTGGFVQLFFAYVENYAPLMPAILLFAYCSYRCFQGRLPLWVPACVLGCIVPLHFSLGSLGPSLLVLGWMTVAGERWRTWAALAAAPLCSIIVLALIGFDTISYIGTPKGVHFLPLLSSPDALHPERMFSGMHLLNFSNQQMLTAPAAVMTLLSLRRNNWSRNPQQLFLATAAAFPLLFTMLLNPEIGAFRDWDTMSVPALPMTICAAHWICRQFGSGRTLKHVATMIVGASLLHTCFWIGVNSDDGRSASRFSEMLEQGRLSAPALAYGWETVGIFERKQNDRLGAIEAYQKAIEAHPENPRYWAMLGALLREGGQIKMSTLAYGKAEDMGSVDPLVYNLLGDEYLRLGDPGEAIIRYKRAIELKPDFAEAYYNLGNLYLEQGAEDSALHQYGSAVRLNPGFAEAYYNSGNIYLKRRAFEEAISSYEKALVAKPDFAQAHYNLGNAAFSLGNADLAADQYRKTLSIDPQHANANFSLGSIYHTTGRLDKAKPHYSRAIELDPEHPAADSIRAWMKE